jgi:hypothetical protein
LVGLLSAKDYAGYADEGRRLAVDVPNVTPMDAARFIAEATPIIGDAMAAKEIYDEATSENPNWALVGALGGAAVLGLFPGIGDAAAKAVKSGASGLLDTAKRVEVDPNAMGSLLGNVRLKPKDDATQTGLTFKDVDKSLSRMATKADNRRIAGDTSRVEEVPIRQLYATQPSVNPDFDTTSSSAGELPLVVRKNGKMFVQDGHHRLTKKAQSGSQTAKVRFIDLDNADTSTPLLDWSPEKTGFVEADNDLLDALFAPSPAEEISGLLASGRADEVTDEMLGKLTPNDNMELFDLYQSGATGMDLPMDEASRMARAKGAGFEGGLFHGTGADIVGVDRSKLGEKQNLLGKGFYQTTSQSRPDRYIPKETDPQTQERVFSQGGNVLPLMSKSVSEFDLTQPTGAENALNIGKVFEGADFDVEYRDNGDQVFIKSKSDPKKSVYIDSYQDGLATVQKLKDTFGRNNVTNILEEAGFSGLRAAEGFNKSTKVNYNPEDVRSKFARFDPRLSNLKNLSAGVALPGAGLLALQEMQKRANEEQQRQGLLQ